MKKIIATLAIVVIILTVLAMPVTAFANSAQRHFMGVASSGAIVTTENCPITVTAERLTFNINSFPTMHDYDGLANYNASVTAEYDFYNPADYRVDMQLVFPFGIRPDYAHNHDYTDADKYSVSVNGEQIDSAIRATYAPYRNEFNISVDMPKISDEPIPFENFDDSTVVYQYSINNHFETVDTAREYVADFCYIDNLFYVSTNGYIRDIYNEKNQNYSGFRLSGSSSFTIYSIGNILPEEFFSPKYYAVSDGRGFYSDDVETPISGTTSVNLTTITLEELVMNYYDEESYVSKLDYRNAVVDYFNQDLRNGTKYRKRYLNSLNINSDLMFWYQYDVSVPSNQTITNTVVAPLYPDVNMAYEPEKYTYVYLLSPASSWASFENLDITINTPSYLLYSSLDGFEKTDYGYFAHFDKLPKDELTFELCASQNPEYDRSTGDFVIKLIIIVLVVIPLCIVAIVAIVVPTVIVSARKKRKKLEGEMNVSCSLEQRDEAMKDFFDANKKQ